MPPRSQRSNAAAATREARDTGPDASIQQKPSSGLAPGQIVLHAEMRENVYGVTGWISTYRGRQSHLAGVSPAIAPSKCGSIAIQR